MEFEATSTAAPAEDPDTAPRGRRILANTVALLILAGAAGVLTPLVVQTDGFSLASWIRGAAPKSSQNARTAEVSTTEARPAAERESRTVDALARELAFAQEEIAALKARLAAEAAQRDHANVARQAAESTAEEHKRALQREWEHAALLEQALGAAHQELQGLRASATVVGTPIPVKTISVSAGAPDPRAAPGERAQAAR
jgi:hypothetical protein